MNTGGMQSIELLQTLSLAAYIAAGVIFLIAIALFFLLDVPKLFGEISGRTAKKAIEAIRRQSESSDNNSHKLGTTSSPKRPTDKITKSGKLRPKTEGLSNQTKPETSSNMSETTVIQGATNETTVLENVTNETTILTDNAPYGETTVLSNDQNVVTVFHEHEGFSVDVEISFSGSSQIIE